MTVTTSTKTTVEDIPGVDARARGTARPAPRPTTVLLPAAGVALLLLVWGWASTWERLASGIPGPGATLARAGRLMVSAEFLPLLGNTLLVTFLGLAITVAVAVPLGLTIASVPVLDRLLSPLIELLRPIPPVVYLPIAVLALGARGVTELVLILSGSLWPLLLQVYQGATHVDPQRLDAVRVYGLTRAQRLRYVTVPSAMPFIMTGLRLTATICLIVAVTVQMIGTKTGLGGAMAQAQVVGDTVALFANVVIVGLVGVLIDVGGREVERRALRWRAASAD